MDCKTIDICSGSWGNLFIDADFRKIDLLPRFTLSQVSRHALIIVVGYLFFNIQLTLWSRDMRDMLKEDSHDTV